MNTNYKFRFGILLKSYLNDINRVDLFIKSYIKYNLESIPLFLVVPKKEIKFFNKYQGDSILILIEEDIIGDDHFEKIHHGMSPGYLNQQIVKLKFWKTGFCENYFCADSDLIFIKDFCEKDFIDDDGIPYLFAIKNSDLITDPDYYYRFWIRREDFFNKLCNFYKYKGSLDFSVHGMISLSSERLMEMNSWISRQEELSYKKLIEYVPLEFSWYLVWCLKKKYEINRRESIIKTFHTRNQHFASLLQGIKQKDLSRGYIAVVLNSNYSDKYNVFKYESSLLRLLIPNVTYVLIWIVKKVNKIISLIRERLTKCFF
jgi:hypothetical protein